MIKEKAYKYKNYQISYDEGLKDRSVLVIGIKDKDTLYITEELYDESANAVIKILDNLQKQLQLKDIEIERLNKEILGLNNCIIEFHSEFCNKQAEINRLNNIINELEELCKTKYYEKNTTDIDSIAIAGNLYVYMYKKIKELKGSDKE